MLWGVTFEGVSWLPRSRAERRRDDMVKYSIDQEVEFEELLNVSQSERILSRPTIRGR